MALTISYDGFGVVANADGTTDSAGGSWAELGGGTISANPDVYLYGSSSIGSKYASKSGFTYFTANTALNFTTTEAGQYIYMWVNIQSAGAFATLPNDGFHAVVGSDTSNYYKFPLAGSDDANGWAGGWKLFVLDITLGQVVGTPDDTAINTFGLWIDTIVSVRADSIFQSQIMCAKGLKVEGTSTDMYGEIVLWCEDYINRAAGMFQSRGQTYFSLGSLTVHSDTALTTVSAQGSNIEYEKSEFHNGTIWTTAYPATANLVSTTDTAGNTVSMTDTNIGISGNDLNKLKLDTTAGTTYNKYGGYIKYLNTLSSITGNTFDGVVFSLYDTRTIGLEAYLNSTFDGSATLTIPTGSTFSNNTVNGTTLIPSVSVTTLEDVSTNTFNSSGSNHGVTLTTIGDGTMDWSTDSTGFDSGTTGSPITTTNTGNETIHITATTGTVTISVGAGYLTPSVKSDGAIVNVLAGQITITFTGVPDGVETRIRQGSFTIFHEQDATGGTVSYTYTHTGDELVTVLFSGSGYVSKRLKLTLSSVDQTLPLVFEIDPSYIT